MKRIRRINEELNVTDLPRLSYQELKSKYNETLPEGPMANDGNAVTWGQMWKDEWTSNNSSDMDSSRETSIGDEEMRISKIDNDKSDIILSISEIIDNTRKKKMDDTFFNELKELVNKYISEIPQITPGIKTIGPEGEKVVEKFSDFRK